MRGNPRGRREGETCPGAEDGGCAGRLPVGADEYNPEAGVQMRELRHLQVTYCDWGCSLMVLDLGVSSASCIFVHSFSQTPNF